MKSPTTHWTEELIEIELLKVVATIGENRMPTHEELRNMKQSGLGKAIYKFGGIEHWAEKLNLPRKIKPLRWDEETLFNEIKFVMNTLDIKRMPNSEEFKSLGRNDLHSAISKRKYSVVAESMGLLLKSSDTTTGNYWENEVMQWLIKQGFQVELTSSKHPYDLLIDGAVKIDVKFANSYLLRGSKVYTYRLAKIQPTCDIYILVGRDHETKELRVHVIPSHKVKMKMLNMGVNSKYNIFLDAYSYIVDYSKFYKKIATQSTIS